MFLRTIRKTVNGNCYIRLLSSNALQNNCIRMQNLTLAHFVRTVQSKSQNIKSKPVGKSEAQSQQQSSVKTQDAEEHLELQMEALSSEDRFLQYQIRRAKTLDDLKEMYNTYKEQLNLLNCCTMLHQASKIARSTDASQKERRLQPGQLLRMREFQELVQHLIGKIDEMDDFALSNFIYNLAQEHYFNKAVIDQTIGRIVGTKLPIQTKALTYVLWSTAKFKQRDDKFLEFCAQRVLKESRIGHKNIANVFWSFSTLQYAMSDKLLQKIEQELIFYSTHYDAAGINVIFHAYQLGVRQNAEVLDALSQRFMVLIKDVPMFHISNLLHFCASLQYINHLLFDTMEQEIIRRVAPLLNEEPTTAAVSAGQLDANNKYQEKLPPQLMMDSFLEGLEQKSKQEALSQKEQSVENDQKKQMMQTPNRPGLKFAKADKLIDDLTPDDAGQILYSFCKMKIVRVQLFEILEFNFINRMGEASPRAICLYSLAHSQLCSEMLQRYYAQKSNFLARSLKSIKKYNDSFYEIVIPNCQAKLNKLSVEDIITILAAASRPLVKRRAINRQIIAFGIQGIDILKVFREKNKQQQELVERKTYEYLRILINFAYKYQMQQQILKAFEEAKIEIQPLMNRYGYLDLKADVRMLSAEAQSTLQKITEDAEEEEDGDGDGDGKNQGQVQQPTPV